MATPFERVVHGFNPTLVRLRPLPPPRPGLGRVPFQSHAGSIEAGRKEAGRAFCAGFNPTLVRLRPEPGRGSRAPLPAFQSHAGSIEADRVEALKDRIALVSIPRWFD